MKEWLSAAGERRENMDWEEGHHRYPMALESQPSILPPINFSNDI